MNFDDKNVECSDCKKEFVFTAGEQDFFAKKGFENPPKRCPDCRANKKAQHGQKPRQGGGGGDRANKPKFPATCSRCGAAFEAPFEPSAGRPVFCRDCYTSSRG